MIVLWFLMIFYDNSMIFYASFYDLFMIFLWLIFFRPRRPNKIMKENKKIIKTHFFINVYDFLWFRQKMENHKIFIKKTYFF